jgi:acetoin utilization protein AcuB
MTEARNLMTKKVITTKVTTPLQAAYEEMKANHIRHLPVVDMAGKLVGIISDRDMLRAVNTRLINASEQEMIFNPHHTVEDFMSYPVQTVDDSTLIEDLAQMMVVQKVSAFIVSGPNQLIKGIVTTEDLLQYLVELLNSTESAKNIPIQKILWKHI